MWLYSLLKTKVIKIYIRVDWGFDIVKGSFKGFIRLGGSLELINFLIICAITLHTDGRSRERDPETRKGLSVSSMRPIPGRKETCDSSHLLISHPFRCAPFYFNLQFHNNRKEEISRPCHSLCLAYWRPPGR